MFAGLFVVGAPVAYFDLKYLEIFFVCVYNINVIRYMDICIVAVKGAA